MSQPKVTKIDGNLINNTTVNLGDPNLSEIITGLIRDLSKGRDTYLIEWEGSRVPRGAIINGETIIWTQHGIVYADGGQGYSKEIGYYERIIDDISKQPQVMLVFC